MVWGIYHKCMWRSNFPGPPMTTKMKAHFKNCSPSAPIIQTSFTWETPLLATGQPRVFLEKMNMVDRNRRVMVHGKCLEISWGLIVRSKLWSHPGCLMTSHSLPWIQNLKKNAKKNVAQTQWRQWRSKYFLVLALIVSDILCVSEGNLEDFTMSGHADNAAAAPNRNADVPNRRFFGARQLRVVLPRLNVRVQPYRRRSRGSDGG